MPVESRYAVETADKKVISKSGKQIYGKLYFPKAEGKFPLVIVSHGYNSSHSNFEKACRTFAAGGVIAYAYDFCGGAVWSRSEGSTTDMTVFTEKEDLLSVFGYITEMDNVDRGKVFLMGESQGGLVTALAAEEISAALRGIILYYPAMMIPDNWRENYPEISDIPEVTELWGMKLGRQFFVTIHDMHPFEVIGRKMKRAIVIEGGSDGLVTMDIVEKTAAAYENSELVVLNGEGHGFTEEGGRIAAEHALRFMLG